MAKSFGPHVSYHNLRFTSALPPNKVATRSLHKQASMWSRLAAMQATCWLESMRVARQLPGTWTLATYCLRFSSAAQRRYEGTKVKKVKPETLLNFPQPNISELVLNTLELWAVSELVLIALVKVAEW